MSLESWLREELKFGKSVYIPWGRSIIRALDLNDPPQLYQTFLRKGYLGANVDVQATAYGYGGHIWTPWMHKFIGDTALHLALKQHKILCVYTLLIINADTNIINLSGETSEDICQRVYHRSTKELRLEAFEKLFESVNPRKFNLLPDYTNYRHIEIEAWSLMQSGRMLYTELPKSFASAYFGAVKPSKIRLNKSNTPKARWKRLYAKVEPSNPKISKKYHRLEDDDDYLKSNNVSPVPMPIEDSLADFFDEGSDYKKPIAELGEPYLVNVDTGEKKVLTQDEVKLGHWEEVVVGEGNNAVTYSFNELTGKYVTGKKFIDKLKRRALRKSRKNKEFMEAKKAALESLQILTPSNREEENVVSSDPLALAGEEGNLFVDRFKHQNTDKKTVMRQSINNNKSRVSVEDDSDFEDDIKAIAALKELASRMLQEKLQRQREEEAQLNLLKDNYSVESSVDAEDALSLGGSLVGAGAGSEVGSVTSYAKMKRFKEENAELKNLALISGKDSLDGSIGFDDNIDVLSQEKNGNNNGDTIANVTDEEEKSNIVRELYPDLSVKAELFKKTLALEDKQRASAFTQSQGNQQWLDLIHELKTGKNSTPAAKFAGSDVFVKDNLTDAIRMIHRQRQRYAAIEAKKLEKSKGLSLMTRSNAGAGDNDSITNSLVDDGDMESIDGAVGDWNDGHIHSDVMQSLNNLKGLSKLKFVKMKTLTEIVYYETARLPDVPTDEGSSIVGKDNKALRRAKDNEKRLLKCDLFVEQDIPMESTAETKSKNNPEKVFSKPTKFDDEYLNLPYKYITELSTRSNLKYMKINDFGMEALSEALRGDCILTSICLSNSRISCRGVHYLSAVLPTMGTSLTYLDLSQNAIADEGLLELGIALPFTTALKTLSLAGNRITRAGVEDILKIVLDPISNLEFMSFCRNVLSAEEKKGFEVRVRAYNAMVTVKIEARANRLSSLKEKDEGDRNDTDLGSVLDGTLHGESNDDGEEGHGEAANANAVRGCHDLTGFANYIASMLGRVVASKNVLVKSKSTSVLSAKASSFSVSSGSRRNRGTRISFGSSVKGDENSLLEFDAEEEEPMIIKRIEF